MLKSLRRSLTTRLMAYFMVTGQPLTEDRPKSTEIEDLPDAEAL